MRIPCPGWDEISVLDTTQWLYRPEVLPYPEAWLTVLGFPQMNRKTR